MLLNANGISTIYYNSFGGKMISVTFIAAYDMLGIISRYVVARYPNIYILLNLLLITVKMIIKYLCKVEIYISYAVNLKLRKIPPHVW